MQCSVRREAAKVGAWEYGMKLPAAQPLAGRCTSVEARVATVGAKGGRIGVLVEGEERCMGAKGSD